MTIICVLHKSNKHWKELKIKFPWKQRPTQGRTGGSTPVQQASARMPHPASPDKSSPTISPWLCITTNLKTDFLSVGTTESNYCFVRSDEVPGLVQHVCWCLYVTVVPYGVQLWSACSQFIVLLLEIYREKKHSLCLPRSSGDSLVSCVFPELETVPMTMSACVCSWPLQHPCSCDLGFSLPNEPANKFVLT